MGQEGGVTRGRSGRRGEGRRRRGEETAEGGGEGRRGRKRSERVKYKANER